MPLRSPDPQVKAVPRIQLFVPGPLRVYCGGDSQVSLEAASVSGALQQIEHRVPALYRCICDETGDVRRHLNVFVNADNIRDLDGVATMLCEGDELIVLPAVSGG